MKNFFFACLLLVNLYACSLMNKSTMNKASSTYEDLSDQFAVAKGNLYKFSLTEIDATLEPKGKSLKEILKADKKALIRTRAIFLSYKQTENAFQVQVQKPNANTKAQIFSFFIPFDTEPTAVNLGGKKITGDKKIIQLYNFSTMKAGTQYDYSCQNFLREGQEIMGLSCSYSEVKEPAAVKK